MVAGVGRVIWYSYRRLEVGPIKHTFQKFGQPITQTRGAIFQNTPVFINTFVIACVSQ